ncbi:MULTISPECIES: sigma-70 family RNA polymerase sigma factor [unclassified Pseudomonas]|uniref:RNA polymerase sigma factor n=1 Tax=unclassified Pseudomonas TaxID=196821 RepID=UPI0011EDC96D|nr:MULTISPECIES: sigma-70 family RNA polymerase sigma factor [unclassified Pseudomonas]KAA0943189.1 sigma-70 family RNA polymerase sigma factor [Pseudomonas sp. ANT_H4]KAA0945884.1 sigma-70 family RNA polymerase sigma factor [Pseudomonas sp. ANT_H14]
MNESEDDLIQRAVTGNRQAFAALVGSHQARVFHFIRRLLGCSDEAADLTQETFIRAFQALPRWRPEARFQTWLLQIARNAALDTLRKRRRHAEDPLEDHAELVDPAPSPLKQLESGRRLMLLERLLAGLPQEQREILLLREVEGLSYDELAATLQINTGTVKSRLARARGALLRAYRQAHGGHTDD